MKTFRIITLIIKLIIVNNKFAPKCTNDDETNLAVKGTMDTGCSLG